MYILDIEASSLSRNSYPIEVAFGRSKDAIWTSLINPSYMENWNDWDIRSQNLHGIERNVLLSQGQDPRKVAQKMIEVLVGEEVYSDEPFYDGMWKNRLLRDSGFDPHLIKIKDLKAYMTNILKCGIHQRKFTEYLKSFSSSNKVKHRAKDDVFWLFDFLEFLTKK